MNNLTVSLYIVPNIMYGQMQNLYFMSFRFTTVKFYANYVHDYLFKEQDKGNW